jgi:hypothetical protein
MNSLALLGAILLLGSAVSGANGAQQKSVDQKTNQAKTAQASSTGRQPWWKFSPRIRKCPKLWDERHLQEKMHPLSRKGIAEM